MAAIVVGVDGSCGGAAALRWAAAEARLRGVSLTLVHAYSGPAVGSGTEAGPTEPAPERQQARRVLDEAVQAAGGLLVGTEIRDVLRPGHAARELTEVSAVADLLVVGMHGAGGFEGLLLGSTAEHCARHARCTVVLVPARVDAAGAGSARIVVGVDGSVPAQAALRWAVTEAQWRGAAIDIVSVYEPYRAQGPYGAEFMDVASPGWRRRFHHAAEQAAVEAVTSLPTPPTVPVQTLVEAGHPSQVLAAKSRTAELVAIGHRGAGGFRGLLLGSVTRQLLHHSSCPVAVVRVASEIGKGQ